MKLVLLAFLLCTILVIGCVNNLISNTIQSTDETAIKGVIKNYIRAVNTQDIALCISALYWGSPSLNIAYDTKELTCAEMVYLVSPGPKFEDDIEVLDNDNNTSPKFELVSVEDIEINGNTAKAKTIYIEPQTNKTSMFEFQLIKGNEGWKIKIKVPR